MPVYKDRMLADLETATSIIIEMNPESGQAKIDRLRAEVAELDAQEKLTLPRISFFYYKITALCDDMKLQEKWIGELPKYKPSYFYTYKISQGNGKYFSYEHYQAVKKQESKTTIKENTSYSVGLPDGTIIEEEYTRLKYDGQSLRQAPLGGMWYTPLFGVNPAFSFPFWNDLYLEKFSPIGFPLRASIADGRLDPPLSFTFHDDDTHNFYEIGQSYFRFPKFFDNLLVGLKKIHENSFTLLADAYKATQFLLFIITHENPIWLTEIMGSYEDAFPGIDRHRYLGYSSHQSFTEKSIDKICTDGKLVRILKGEASELDSVKFCLDIYKAKISRDNSIEISSVNENLKKIEDDFDIYKSDKAQGNSFAKVNFEGKWNEFLRIEGSHSYCLVKYFSIGVSDFQSQSELMDVLIDAGYPSIAKPNSEITTRKMPWGEEESYYTLAQIYYMKMYDLYKKDALERFEDRAIALLS